MKIYDIIFAIASLAGLYAVGLTMKTAEAVVSGLVIGAYAVWRMKK